MELHEALPKCEKILQEYWRNMLSDQSDVYKVNDTDYCWFDEITGRLARVVKTKVKLIKAVTCPPNSRPWRYEIDIPLPTMLSCLKFYSFIVNTMVPSLITNVTYRSKNSCFEITNAVLPFNKVIPTGLQWMKINPKYFYFNEGGRKVFRSPTLSQFLFLKSINHPLAMISHDDENDY